MCLNFYLKVAECEKARNTFYIFVEYTFSHDLRFSHWAMWFRFDNDTLYIAVVTYIGTIAGERLDTHRCFFPIGSDHRRDRQFKFEPHHRRLERERERERDRHGSFTATYNASVKPRENGRAHVDSSKLMSREIRGYLRRGASEPERSSPR